MYNLQYNPKEPHLCPPWLLNTLIVEDLLRATVTVACLSSRISNADDSHGCLLQHSNTKHLQAKHSPDTKGPTSILHQVSGNDVDYYY